jgi:polygalacturonase
MVGARNITFRNINFSDTSGNGIDVIDCKDVKIENCEVYNIRKEESSYGWFKCNH